MKLASLQLLLTPASIVLGAVSPDEKVWEPPRLDYRDLVSATGRDSLVNDAERTIHDALLTGNGILSITKAIPQSKKVDLYDAMMHCAMSPETAKEIMYPDGTKRVTWAASSSGSVNKCEELSKVADPVRKQVGEVMSHLSLLIEASLTKMGRAPFFPAASTGAGLEGYSLHELFSRGEQLDHFHVYSNAETSYSNKAELKTIDWHTDYGFALAFLPGHILSQDGASAQKYTPSKGFFIQLPDGSAQEVTFTEEDDVVIMLGDGVAHIKNAIEDHQDFNLRAVPHAFVMPDRQDALRMWYGRMMLFPLDAIHSTLHQTFGAIQKSLNADPSYHLSSKQEGRTGYPLGCSSPQALSPRLLADETMDCESDQFMCWHTCFNNTEELSPEGCASKNLELACVNTVNGTLWDGINHCFACEPTCFSAAEGARTDEVAESVANATNEVAESATNATNAPSVTPNADEATSPTSSETEETTSTTMPTSSSAGTCNGQQSFAVGIAISMLLLVV
ncbi:hypothetical protein HJC23_005588 [Cyclotella cryptica]|uniref:Fe2OG dioxygenase domain-containing protein n=1 Tax=Cyclotella cryptica TaxID=29204 RepID=A0ABD3PS98_9STRA|eukprot:CCRYP_012501-RA/>CCRYP_012501-RA protein AED:0.10 eAED:0.10 QI:0/-1/0/1/-1/1/1/0/506